MQVKIIKSDGKAALVESVTDGMAYRRIVPVHLVNLDETNPSVGKMEFSDFGVGIEYGLPFAQFINPGVTALQVETALHNAGIWTLEDLQSKGRQAIGALQSVYSLDLGRILQAAQNYLKEARVEKPVAAKRKSTKKEVEP
jgi:hypothetical protein